MQGSPALDFLSEVGRIRVHYFIPIPQTLLNQECFLSSFNIANMFQGQNFTTPLAKQSISCFISRFFDDSPLPGVNSNRISLSSFLEFLWKKQNVWNQFLNLCTQTLSTYMRKAGPQDCRVPKAHMMSPNELRKKPEVSFNGVGFGQSKEMGKQLGPPI